MTNAIRISLIRVITMIRLLAVGLLFLAATAGAQTRPPIVEKLAKTYGLDSWGQIEAIRYTFNIDIPGLQSRQDRGPGSRKPTASLLREKTRQAIRSRLRTYVRRSVLSLTT